MYFLNVIPVSCERFIFIKTAYLPANKGLYFSCCKWQFRSTSWFLGITANYDRTENVRKLFESKLQGTEVTKLLGIDIYIAGYRAREKSSKPLNIHWNRTEMAKIWHTNTGKRSRDKVSHFCSIYSLYFRLQNTFVNSHTNSYNLRHCVTLIVTLKLQRDNKKVKRISFERS